MNTKIFALIGAAGYIAPRHMQAIRDTGNSLVAAFDPNDSVGIIDSYFPKADFFVEFERFDRHLDKLRRSDPSRSVDYVSICSPNYLHDAHVRFGLRSGAHVICEKPTVLNPWNLEALMAIEAESPGRVYSILQLRLHPAIRALRERIASSSKTFDLRLTYVTSRGNWYGQSWKGDVRKSGGIATNIGVHFFDMLHWIFGDLRESTLHFADERTNAGLLVLDRARIQWLLSIDEERLPVEARTRGARTFRNLEIDGESFEFSEGFTGLHTACYEALLAGRGFSLQDSLPAIRTVSDIRNRQPVGLVGDYHPALRLKG